MHPLTRNCFLGFATAGALALTVGSTPSFAGDPPEVLGPVGRIQSGLLHMNGTSRTPQVRGLRVPFRS